MYQQVVHIFQGIFNRRGANITIAIPVSLENAIDSSDKDVASDITLPVLDQQAVLYIALDNHWAATWR
jgi:hypothetical protein